MPALPEALKTIGCRSCLAIGLLLPAPAARGQPAGGCCAGRYSPAALPRVAMKPLGQEYHRLRQLSRGACGECSHYGSALHRVLTELGKRLNGRPATEIRRVLGPPDVVRDSTLVYYWRGEHDYLRFRLTSRGTAASSWYFAYE